MYSQISGVALSVSAAVATVVETAMEAPTVRMAASFLRRLNFIGIVTFLFVLGSAHPRREGRNLKPTGRF
jgi:hypothetical protein